MRRASALIALALILLTSNAFADGFGSLLDLGKKLVPVVPKAVQSVTEANKDMTPEQEYTLGRAFGAQLLQSHKVSNDEKANHYINVLGQALARFSDLPETYAGYHFQILESPEVNAFSAPGGLIFITTGLILMTHNEDELAAVLAHEIGHVAKRHGVEAIKKDRQTKAWVGIGADTASALGSDQMKQAASSLRDSVSDLTSTIIDKGYSRDTEYQADAAAVTVLTRAGYPTEALVDMIRSLNAIPEAGKGGLTKTHPAPDDRIAHLHSLVLGKTYTVSGVQAERYRVALAGLK